MLGQENNSVAKHVIDRFEELDQYRTVRADELDLIAKLYRPQRQGFRGSNRDQWNLHKQFNSTGLTAAKNASASIYSTICNPANRWMVASSGDDELDKFDSVATWLEIVTKRMLMSFGNSMSNFYPSAVTVAGDCSALGTSIMVSDEWPNGRKRFIDTCVSPADCVIGVDAAGEVDELIVEHRLTAVQAARRYGYETLPEKLQERASSNNHTEKTVFYQAIQPNDDYTPGRIGAKGKPFVSTHVSVEGKTVVKQGGMSEQNFGVARWSAEGDNPWGRGLGYLTLASALKLQSQERDNLQAGALAARPPIATTGSKAMRQAAQLQPGHFLHGGITPNGQPAAKPIFTHQGLPVTLDMVRATKEEVENGWHAQLLMLVGRTGLGNLEVIEQMEERYRLQAPYMGRMQSEWMTPIADRRFSMMFRAGQIPPPPEELKGRPLIMKYTGVSQLAQRSQEGVAVSRLLEDVYKLAQYHPRPEEVWDNIDSDGAIDVLAEARGVPRRAITSDDKRDKVRADRAEQQEAAAAMEQAAAGASVAKDMAGAAPLLDQLGAMQ